MGSVIFGILMFVVFQMNPVFAGGQVSSVGISIFHTIFNISNTLILFPFAKQLVDLSGKIVKAFSEEEKEIVPVRTAAGLTKTMAPRREDTIRVEELPRVPGDIADFHRNVAAVLLRGEEPAVKLPEVKRVMRLMETVFESAEKNHVMDFE